MSPVRPPLDSMATPSVLERHVIESAQKRVDDYLALDPKAQEKTQKAFVENITQHLTALSPQMSARLFQKTAGKFLTQIAKVDVEAALAIASKETEILKLNPDLQKQAESLSHAAFALGAVILYSQNLDPKFFSKTSQRQSLRRDLLQLALGDKGLAAGEFVRDNFIKIMGLGAGIIMLGSDTLPDTNNEFKKDFNEILAEVKQVLPERPVLEDISSDHDSDVEFFSDPTFRNDLCEAMLLIEDPSSPGNFSRKFNCASELDLSDEDVLDEGTSVNDENVEEDY